ncbi:MAG: GIDE domain-containing protein [Candidatus Sulfotelmatobacter sp.]
MLLAKLIIASLLVRSDGSSHAIAACVIGIGVGIYLFYQGFRLLQRRRLILDTPASKIRSASVGMVELSGLAVGPYTLTAPVTTKPCYYHRTFVWELRQCGKNKQWVKVAAECMHVPFFLDDNTGKVMVDPRGAELDLHRDFRQEFCDSFFTTKEEVPANVRMILQRHGISTTNKIKVEEFCIKPKNALFVLGTLGENPGLELTPQPIPDDEAASPNVWNAPLSLSRTSVGQTAMSLVTKGVNSLSLSGGLQHDPAFDPIYEQASARVVHLSSAPSPTQAGDMTQQQRVAAALMKAGISNPAAWSAAGVSPQVSPNLPSHANAPDPTDGFDPHPPVVLTKGKNNSTFLISWRSQREVARSLGWKCTLMIWGGPALTLLSLYGLLTLTHMI